ncbi:O-antigen ligase family protein [Parerythrobacter aurantius]|uniref:O-antigen ligase family protein n=1 Tax=Parerythrobacter aurantius TaxID=3127706 RepID=UPI00325310E2
MARSGVDRKSEVTTFMSLRGWSAPLIVLAVFLVAVFLLGGSSRFDVPQLILLRPLAVCVAGYALVSMRFEYLRSRRALWCLAGATLLLVALHLVPLPPAMWQALPGRGIMVEIDKVAGLAGLWRPLTMFPEGTWNALYALVVPLAVALLATRFDLRDNLRLMLVILVLAGVSAIVGVIQAAGSDLAMYRLAGGTSGLFANRNHQAALLACLIPVLAGLSQAAPQVSGNPRALRILAAATAVALVPLILVTGSRMGLLVTIAALLYAAASYLLVSKGVPSKGIGRLALLAAGAASLVAMVGATIYAARDVAIDRIDAEGEDLRLAFWESTLEFLPDYMPWGSGVGSFVPVYQIHEKAEMLMPQYINQAHNDWLDIALTAGVPGLALLLVAVVMFLVALRNAFTARGVAGHLRRMGVGIILLLAFASLSDYPLRTPILSSLFAVAAIWSTFPVATRPSNESNA